MSIKAVVFDLMGTLLDTSALDPHFVRIFGTTEVRESWYQQVNILAMTTVPTLAHRPFDKLANAALQMVGAKRKVVVPGADGRTIVEALSTLPVFPDVPMALKRLQDGGYKLVALTNGTRKAAKAQLKASRVDGSFDLVLSADDVEQFKPGPKPYLYAAKQLGLKPGKMVMVAAHAWDLQGARAVGMYTAFIERPGESLNPQATKPDYIASDLGDLARQLL